MSYPKGVDRVSSTGLDLGSHPSVECHRCDIVAATVAGLKDRFDAFKETVEKQLDKQSEALTRQETSSNTRHEELKRSMDGLKDILSNSPNALMQRMVLVEEKNATLTKMLAFVATTTMAIFVAVVGSVISGVVHLK
jgi:hypothetical protein